MFKLYRITRYTVDINYRKTNEIYQMLKKYINNGEATIFSIPGHEMTGCGYVRLRAVYYTDAARTKRHIRYYDFVVVNDTWADSSNFEDQYSYYPVDMIDTKFMASRQDKHVLKQVGSASRCK